MILHVINPMVRARVDHQLEHALGPLIVTSVLTEGTIEVMRDPDGALVVEDQHGRRVVGTMPDRQAELIIATVAAMHQRVANVFNPVVEAELLIGQVNTRFTCALAPMVAVPTISIRVPSWTGYSLDDYVAQSMMSLSGPGPAPSDCQHPARGDRSRRTRSHPRGAERTPATKWSPYRLPTDDGPTGPDQPGAHHDAP
jgi:hypothetical protein